MLLLPLLSLLILLTVVTAVGDVPAVFNDVANAAGINDDIAKDAAAPFVVVGMSFAAEVHAAAAVIV